VKLHNTKKKIQPFLLKQVDNPAQCVILL